MIGVVRNRGTVVSRDCDISATKKPTWNKPSFEDLIHVGLQDNSPAQCFGLRFI